MTVGVISDTHGLLRAEVMPVFAGVSRILHAGDVGDAAILDQLAGIAPVTAIRGNVDRTGRCAALSKTEYVTVDDRNIYMLHDLADLDLDPAAARISVILYGHSHKPSITWRKGVLFFNPGAAGPRRFSLPVSLGLLDFTPAGPAPRLITLL